jgi:hypothetical protein
VAYLHFSEVRARPILEYENHAPARARSLSIGIEGRPNGDTCHPGPPVGCGAVRSLDRAVTLMLPSLIHGLEASARRDLG